jgi:hypothetical protein
MTVEEMFDRLKREGLKTFEELSPVFEIPADTFRNWHLKGVRSRAGTQIRLDALPMGRTFKSSEAAVFRVISALAASPPATARRRAKASQK